MVVFGNAAALDFSVVLQDCVMLRTDCSVVRRQFFNLTVQSLELLNLVLDVKLLHGLLNLVLLRLLVVAFLGIRFGKFFIGVVYNCK